MNDQPCPDILSADAIAKLRTVQQAILKEPRLYDQEEPYVSHHCGTAGCVCGWIVLLFGTDAQKRRDGRVSAATKLILDIPRVAVDRLFDPYFGRSEIGCDLWRRYARALPHSSERAQVASDWIDHFIATDTWTETRGEESSS